MNPTEVVNPTDPKPRDPSTELAKPIPVEIVTLVDIDQLAEAHKKFGEFKHRILTRDDWMVIQGRNFLKKSAWRKWALGCGVSDELVSLERIPAEGRTKDGEFQYRVISNAIHRPTGRSSIGVAAASNKEKANWAHEEHDVLTLAHTRSKTRAISDLVGGGEVSAEEIVPDTADQRPTGKLEQPEIGTASPSEAPVPESSGPSQPIEITVGKVESEPISRAEWKVPVTTEIRDDKKIKSRKLTKGGEGPVFGVLHVAIESLDEISAVPAKPFPANDPALTSYMVKRFLEDERAAHPDFTYELLTEENQLQAILIRTKLDEGKIKAIESNALWTFEKALTRTASNTPLDRSHLGSPLR